MTGITSAKSAKKIGMRTGWLCQNVVQIPCQTLKFSPWEPPAYTLSSHINRNLEICSKMSDVTDRQPDTRLTRLFSRTTWVSRHHKVKPIWFWVKQEMIGCHWYRLDHMQIICTSLQTDNHASKLSHVTSTLSRRVLLRLSRSYMRWTSVVTSMHACFFDNDYTTVTSADQQHVCFNGHLL